MEVHGLWDSINQDKPSFPQFLHILVLTHKLNSSKYMGLAFFAFKTKALNLNPQIIFI